MISDAMLEQFERTVTDVDYGMSMGTVLKIIDAYRELKAENTQLRQAIATLQESAQHKFDELIKMQSDLEEMTERRNAWKEYRTAVSQLKTESTKKTLEELGEI